MAPENVSPLVAWLASSQSAHVTGRVFEVEGGKLGIATGYQHGPTVDKGARWEPAELTAGDRRPARPGAGAGARVRHEPDGYESRRNDTSGR